MRLADEAATARLGQTIAAALQKGDVVLLSGELGAGKSALARSILRARGVTGSIPSPTFTLVQSYETPNLTIHHFDLYRVRNPRELDELGLEDAIDTGALLVEWPERAADRFPADALSITLSQAGGEARDADIAGPGRWRSILGVL